MREDTLPLFPLQVVLFPEALLSLHIFEQRYKILIRECLNAGTTFGINLVRDGTIARVGCTAFVRDVTRRYDDGRMDIVVEGEQRFTVSDYDTGAAGYLVGRIHYLENTAEPVDRDLAQRTINLHKQVIELVYRGVAREQHPSTGHQSYWLAQKAGLELSRRQQLLEMDSENDRLKMLEHHLAGVIPKLNKVEEINRVIRSDGYL